MNPIDILAYGQADVVRTIRRLAPDDWTAIALGTWTTKDLVGHLGAFEVRMADVLATFAAGEAPTALMTADRRTFNDDQAAIRSAWTVDAVMTEFEAAHERVMDHARRIAADVWRETGTIPWYGPEYSLDDLVVYTMYGHKREHNPQLEAVLERPGR
jgi:hypothetical protein